MGRIRAAAILEEIVKIGTANPETSVGSRLKGTAQKRTALRENEEPRRERPWIGKAPLGPAVSQPKREDGGPRSRIRNRILIPKRTCSPSGGSAGS